MRKIEFLKTVACDGRTFQAGDVIEAESLSLDHVATCLRLGHAVEVPDLKSVTRGQLVTLQDGLSVYRTGPTEDDHRAAVAEIERLRGLLAERTADAVELTSLRSRVADLESELAALKAGKLAEPSEPDPAKPAEPQSATEPEHPPAPEPKPKPPAVGPSKPPELKAGGKK